MENTKTKKSRAGKIILWIVLIAFVVFSAVSLTVVYIVYGDNFSRAEMKKYTASLRYEDIKDMYSRRDVEFMSGKNKLCGWVYGEDNDKGMVVISHGIGGGGEGYTAEILAFLEAGYRVFSFDNTGSWHSEGKGTMGLAQSVLDLDAALTYIESSNVAEGLPVLLYGHSWGGYAVASIFHFGHDITASVSVAGYNTPGEMLLDQAVEMMGGFGYVEYPYIMLYNVFLFGNKANLSASEALNKTEVPVLIIHGTEDEMVPFDSVGIIAHRDEITNKNVQYKVIDEAGHAGHNNIFNSDESIEYGDVLSAEYNAVKESYGGEIPENVESEWYLGVDKFLASELNPDFIGSVLEFFDEAVK